jgi:Fe-S cluster assembly protein SufD
MPNTRTIIDWLADEALTITVARKEKLILVVPVLKVLDGPRKRTITLAGDGAEAEVLGLYLGRGTGALTLQVDTIHAAPNTKGHTVFKAVLADQSSLQFDGMIKIESGAQGSNDFLQQDSLLLSSEAKANSVPGLEIEANDVKASHGATAKPVDPEQKFYLMSRGLTEPQAEAMIVRGFCQSIISRIPDQAVQAECYAQLDQQL